MVSFIDLGSNTGNAASLTLTVPAGGIPATSTILVAVDNLGGYTAITSVSDTINSYLNKAGANNNGNSTYGGTAVFICQNCTAVAASSTITITMSGIHACAAAGLAIVGIGALDLVTTPTTGVSNSPSITSGIPASSGETFVGVVGNHNASSTYNQPSGWATPPDSARTGNVGIAGGWILNTGISTVKFAPTFSGTTQWSAFLFSFKPISSSFIFALPFP